MMETIKVNMTPCEDIKTIHASQNDNEAREWGFELHNNGEKIDSSSISDQLVFKAYEGGTEEILPTNGSTPTTSPFKGDIKYPQGLLADQEFTYRESPTESDGLAFVESIKGNTIVWNQLVQNGNFENTNGWNFNNPSSASVSSNTLTVSANADATMGFPLSRSMASTQGHKYLIMCDVRCSQANQVRVRYPFVSSAKSISANTWTRFAEIGTATEGQTLVGIQENGINGVTYDYKNFVAFDLTQMGLDISSPSDFTSLFSLPYYDYNQGTLLSFMGNGIKTVGKNLLPLPIAETKNGITLSHNGDGSITLKGTATVLTYFDFSTSFDSSKYEGCLFSCRTPQTVNPGVLCRISQSNRVGIQDLYINTEATVQDNGEGLYFAIRIAIGTVMPTDGYILYPMLRMPSQDATFEPYTSSTLSLPIFTYFPNGMKSAGNVYDELTETKAITRIGAVDMGTLNWLYNANNNRFSTSGLVGMYKWIGSRLTPFKSSIYSILSNGESFDINLDMVLYSGGNDQNILVQNHSYTNAAAFKSAMSGVYLYYELATPTETSFTTASLVTENTEIPLSNDDGTLIGKCTEQLSSESGFFDAKIKLSDSDGECYSNKIQLHVERKPS